jgi:uncharacterized membrane protein
MAKKFDTNPLDPEFPEKVRETQKDVKTAVLPNQNGRTQKFADPVETEEQTRKFNEAEFDSYQTPFGNADNQPANYQPKSFYNADTDAKKSHNIGSISLPENVLTALPYVPFGPVGIIAAVIELIFIPKSEPKIRYHAAQGLAAQSGIWLILAVLGSMEWVGGFEAIGLIFKIVTTIMLIVFAVKAWQGKPIHIESVESLTDWLEERIKPQN